MQISDERAKRLGLVLGEAQIVVDFISLLCEWTQIKKVRKLSRAIRREIEFSPDGTPILKEETDG